MHFRISPAVLAAAFLLLPGIAWAQTAGTVNSSAQTQVQAQRPDVGIASPSPMPPLDPAVSSLPIPTPPLTSAAASAAATTAAATSVAAKATSPIAASALNGSGDPIELQAEQAALQAQAEAEAVQQRREQEYNRKSYGRASTGLLPLSPDQVRDFMNHLQRVQEAAVPPYEGTPKGKVRIANISLDPGADPPLIHLSAGYITTINMLDATGEPWPILDVGVGGNFDVSPTKSDTHIVRIMPLTRYSSGNISVLLKDLATPVIFRLVSDSSSDVDLRFDARVPKYGPTAKAPLVDRQRLEAGDETIMSFLQNMPPHEAKRIKVTGLDGRTMAWALGDKVFVRTPLTLLSPAWNASVVSADGMEVYEIGNAPVLLMSDNGAVVRAHISQDSDHD